jgi:type III secretion protein V
MLVPRSPSEGQAFVARADVVLAAAAMAVVAMLVIPLPTFVLDLLLSLNLAIGAVLLLVSLYVRSAAALTALPSILLLTTLLRLSLNVSSTRLILLQADAGQVIDAFGDFVVQGNFVVGAVVFLLLTLVQFIVIARGSERVAEVAARFSLDSMPGRQMAIDADMRAGAIDLETARRQRAELHRESRFHGAMDGAMKFVKGDAIASIVITVINILGGLIVGVGQGDMALGEAAEVYTLLTIGDGLVSQIPALLIATGAGIVVTRVAGDSEHLGGDIASQLLAHPRALGFAAGLLLVLALIPGLPLVPFVVLAAVVGGLAVLAYRRGKSGLITREQRYAPLSVSAPAQDHAAVRRAWAEVVARLESDLGVHPPPLALLAATVGTGAEIRVRRVPEETVAVGEVGPALERVARRHATDLLGLQEVDALLKAVREVAPADVEAVVPRHLDLAAFRAVLGGLLDEGVPISDLRSILGTLAVSAPRGVGVPTLIEEVRGGLRRAITHQLTSGTGALSAVTVGHEVEAMVSSCLREGEAGKTLVMSPSIARDIAAAAGEALHDGDVLLTAPETRRHLRALLAPQFPGLRVVAHTELTPDIVVTPTGELRVGR